jgi:hypothetical protein
MTKFNFARGAAFLTSLLVFALMPSALAQVSAGPTGTASEVTTTYTYTGNPFTGFHGSSACPPQCKITGSFTIAGPPPANLTLSDQQFQFDITPLAYSFTDGIPRGRMQMVAQISLRFRLMHLGT